MEIATFRAMGTEVEVRARDVAGLRATRGLFTSVEERCSRFLPDSELSRINDSEDDVVRVSPELAAVLEHAAAARSATGGLVDIGVGGAVCAWGYAATFEEVHGLSAPPEQSAQPQWAIEGTVLRRSPGTALDLGGIAKGWACDVAVDTGLATMVSAGGDIRSNDPATEVEVRDPWGHPVARVTLGIGALATSSVTRRTWPVGDGEAHHLIDPRSGRPAESPVLSATVLAATAVEAEAGAKAALLWGADGLAWAAAQDWIGAALVVWHDGSVYATSSLEVAA